MIPAEALHGGFADPVYDAQSVFRAVLDALSSPGRIVELAPSVDPPSPLHAATAAIVAVLADDGTPVFLDAALSSGAAPAWVGFHAGAPVVSTLGEAAFALIGDPMSMPAFSAFAQGSAEYPDRSATLVIQVESLEGGRDLTLTGPGIDGSARLAPHPLPEDFVARMRENRALFPLGVDLFIVAGRRIAGLPRSTRISEMSAG
jgi:alpha-D-ribose 1-methylphosphonate 5-triphosphate synthase subunit PhnH